MVLSVEVQLFTLVANVAYKSQFCEAAFGIQPAKFDEPQLSL